MSESPRARLHRLIREVRSGALDTQSFCARFETTYNLELDRSTLTSAEAEAFAELFEKVVWYSPFPAERERMPHDLGEEDIAHAVERAALRVGISAGR